MSEVLCTPMTQNIEASPNVPKWQASGRLPFKQNQLGTLKDDLSMWGKRVGIRETCQCTTKGRFYTTMLAHNQTSKITILPMAKLLPECKQQSRHLRWWGICSSWCAWTISGHLGQRKHVGGAKLLTLHLHGILCSYAGHGQDPGEEHSWGCPQVVSMKKGPLQKQGAGDRKDFSLDLKRLPISTICKNSFSKSLTKVSHKRLGQLRWDCPKSFAMFLTLICNVQKNYKKGWSQSVASRSDSEGSSSCSLSAKGGALVPSPSPLEASWDSSWGSGSTGALRWERLNEAFLFTPFLDFLPFLPLFFFFPSGLA